jgi:hypothetical protein
LANPRSKQYARQRTAYVIRNARMDPEWASVDRRLFSIVAAWSKSGDCPSKKLHDFRHRQHLKYYWQSRQARNDGNLNQLLAPDWKYAHLLDRVETAAEIDQG